MPVTFNFNEALTPEAAPVDFSKSPPQPSAKTKKSAFKSDILKAIEKSALDAGLFRAAAAVFSVIGFWERYEGGVEIGGKTYRYRSASDLIADTNYAERQVKRAKAALLNGGYVETKVFRNPTKPWMKTTGYHVLEKGVAILEDANNALAQKGPGKKGQKGTEQGASMASSTAPELPYEKCQDGPFIDTNTLQDNKAGEQADELSKAPGEIVSPFHHLLQGDDLVWTKKDTEILYDGYALLVQKHADLAVPGLTPKVREWIDCFVGRVRSQPGMKSRKKVVAVLEASLDNWSGYASALALTLNKMSIQCEAYPTPYLLGTYGYAIINKYRADIKSAEEAEIKKAKKGMGWQDLDF